MKYIDFGIQTLILGFGIVLLATTLGEHDWPMSILYVQLLLGPWQFFSSLISVAARAEFHKEKLLHLLISIGYLLILFIASNSMPAEWVKFFVTVPAWILAFYYYTLTYRWTFLYTKTSGGFLRHLNF